MHKEIGTLLDTALEATLPHEDRQYWRKKEEGEQAA
jgi:hypothetical protein